VLLLPFLCSQVERRGDEPADVDCAPCPEQDAVRVDQIHLSVALRCRWILSRWCRRYVDRAERRRLGEVHRFLRRNVKLCQSARGSGSIAGWWWYCRSGRCCRSGSDLSAEWASIGNGSRKRQGNGSELAAHALPFPCPRAFSATATQAFSRWLQSAGRCGSSRRGFHCAFSLVPAQTGYS